MKITLPICKYRQNTLTSAIQTNLFTVPPSAENNHFSREQYDSFIDGWEKLMDKKEGGFSSAPKFPMPVVWEFLLQYHYITGNESALNYVKNTLEAMAKGGIYDQIGRWFFKILNRQIMESTALRKNAV